MRRVSAQFDEHEAAAGAGNQPWNHSGGHLRGLHCLPICQNNPRPVRADLRGGRDHEHEMRNNSIYRNSDKVRISCRLLIKRIHKITCTSTTSNTKVERLEEGLGFLLLLSRTTLIKSEDLQYLRTTTAEGGFRPGI